MRRLSWQGSLDYVTDAADARLENRDAPGNFDIEFHNSDLAASTTRTTTSSCREASRSRPEWSCPPGATRRPVDRLLPLGQQRKISGTVSASWGTFYEGTRTETTSGAPGFLARFLVEPSLTLNWVELPFGDFTTQLLSARFIVTPTPRMSISGLVQLTRARHGSSSLRLRWEYMPGSELFLVYSDGRDTRPDTNRPVEPIARVQDHQSCCASDRDPRPGAGP